MANHPRNPKEEARQAFEAAKKAVEEAAKPITPPTEPVTPPVEPVTLPVEPIVPPVTPEPVTPPVEPVTPEPLDEPKPGDVDYKKRYTDSSREAIVLAVKNKELNGAIDEAANIPDPTDDEMKAAYPGFDEEMTATEQQLARESLLNKKRFELINNATQKYKKIEDWHERVDTFVTDPKTLIANPDLEGKQDEFKIFASKPSRAGMDFEDLVLAFQGEEAKKPKITHSGQMFPTGTGGSNKTIEPPDDRLTIAQGAALMQTDYNKWKELAKAGRIRLDK